MSKVDKFLAVLSKAIIAAGALLLLIMTISTSLQVIGRYCFGEGFIWTDELSRYCMLYVTMLGAVLVTEEKGHISIDFLDTILPNLAVYILNFVRLILSIALGLVVLYYARGTLIAVEGALSTAIPIPMFYIYVIFPICFALMILYQIAAIIKLAQAGPKSVKARLGEESEGGDAE